MADNGHPMGGLAMQAGGVPSFMKLIKKLTTGVSKAEKAGDIESALALREQLNEAIRLGVNDPLMPRAKPLSQAELMMYAERMAPQVAGELTREAKGARTVAGKAQKQFKREQTLPVERKVLPGAVDPSAPLPTMTLEDQKGSVLLGLPGDPTLARVSLSGIGDVPFEQAVTLHGGPRYGDEEKLWASNLSAATGFLNAADRASRQYDNASVIASYMKMPSGFGFAQHYLESLLQYQRPDLLGKAAKEALENDIKAGFVKDKKRITFPNFPGFDDLGAVAQAAEGNSNLRKHLAAKLSTSDKYGLRPAADVQFAVSHPELTNLETGASGFTLGELIPGRLTESAHPSYSHDIPGKVLGQTQYPTPYDLLYRDQLQLIRNNPEAPEFNTLKMLGARQNIDEQFINEVNEYQERMRRLLGRKKGGAVKKAEGGLAPYGIRHSGEGVKGKGYFGLLPNKMDGVSTEISVEDESGEYPLIVPTLTAEELDRLLAGKEPTPEMLEKASSWAATRRKRGESPFASPTELRMPRPKAEGGSMEASDDEVLLTDEQLRSLEEYRRHLELQRELLKAELERMYNREYWAGRGPNSADEIVFEESPEYLVRKAAEYQYGMPTAIPEHLEKAPPFQLHENYLIDPEFVEERQSRRFYKKGGAVKKAQGGPANLTDLPDEVTPANWREHLQTNVLNDARSLLGVKDGGVINLDELIEKALKKKDGGVINLDELIEWTLAKAEHRKMKEGGAVKMQGGGNPGEVSGEMFKPKPLSIPEPITDLVEALRRQFEKEKRSMRKPGAAQDVLLRGPVAAYAGAPADILGMGGELLDYAQKKIPALRKPASVMDTGPEKTPPMGYAPVFPLSPEGSYGTTAVQEMMGKAGLTTGEERPLFEMGAMFGAPVAGYAGLKAGKALAPTAMDMLDVELANMMKPYQMAVAPEGKSGKVKAPANPVGFYNPAEKAALNLQRKRGSGSAFISDLKKQPGVTDERIAELGLSDLASNPNVTRDEVIAIVEQNRIPLRESVRRPYDETAEYADTVSGIEDSLIFYRGAVKDVQAEMERISKMAPNSPLAKQYEEKLATMRSKVDELEAQLDSTKPAKFGPDVDESYSMPGGEDYREIRVRLPSNKRKMSYEDWRKSGSSEEWSSDGVVGTDFMHQTHHDDEPNVLFHLRVANHADEEGKRGLLIDELQSDWHQVGREKGYKGERLSDEERRKLIQLHNRTVRSDAAPLNEIEAQELQRLTDKDRASFVGVPNAPFKDNWYQLGLKRAIKEAADTGMDRVYLTTGARQADRYDLSKRVNEVIYSDQGVLYARGKDGETIINQKVPQDKLADYIGKDAAEKLINTKEDVVGSKVLSGVDLKVGGEGMKQWYDKTYKNYLEKYAKQHGGKLGETRLQIGEEENSWPAFRDWFAAKYPPGSARGGSGTALYQWEEGANNKFVKEFVKGLEKKYEPVYYIDITDAMRESAKKGQSYAYGGGVFNTDPDKTDAGRIIPEHTI